MNAFKFTFFLFIFGTVVQAQSLYFPPKTGTTWETTTPESLGFCSNKVDSLYTYLETNNTKAFILLKDGRIVLEKYFGTHTQTSNWYWASAGKTITSFMVGLAQQDQLLSISDNTSKYLGQGWTSCTAAQEDKITIRHQLTMSSGLDDGVADPYCTTPDCLVYKADAGFRWAYHNGPYTLLDKVIEKATGKTYNTYIQEKLKTPTGMTGSFIASGSNNVFYSNARSMARFGLLILNKGNWDGKPILTDMNYFDAMTKPSQTLNKSYGYLWWLNGYESYMVPTSQIVINGPMTPNAPADMICALGKNGQFINVVPSENLVWIRMGEAPSNDEVPFTLNDAIWAYINAFKCKTLDVANFSNQDAPIIAPNPVVDQLSIQNTAAIDTIEIINLNGQLLLEVANLENDKILDVSTFEKGIYFIKFTSKGKVTTQKFIKL